MIQMLFHLRENLWFNIKLIRLLKFSKAILQPSLIWEALRMIMAGIKLFSLKTITRDSQLGLVHLMKKAITDIKVSIKTFVLVRHSKGSEIACLQEKTLIIAGIWINNLDRMKMGTLVISWWINKWISKWGIAKLLTQLPTLQIIYLKETIQWWTFRNRHQ